MEINFWQYWPVGLYFLFLLLILGGARFFKTFKMDSEPLTKQTLFWLSIIVPIFSFLYFGSFAWKEYVLKIDADGFKKFIEVSALPLGLLSLSIPFTSVVNNIHRTIQTNKQIKEAMTKNNSDLFYSHQNNFISFINSSVDFNFNYELNLYVCLDPYAAKSTLINFHAKSQIQPLDYYNLYYFLFKNNSAINYNVCPDLTAFDDLIKVIKKLDLLFKKQKNLERFYLYKTRGFRFLYLISIYVNKMLSELRIKNINNLDCIDLDTAGKEFNSNYRYYFLRKQRDVNYIKIVLSRQAIDITLTTNILNDSMLRVTIKNIFNTINSIYSFIGENRLEIDKFPHILKYLNNTNISIFNHFGVVTSIKCSSYSKEEVTLKIH